MSLVVRNKWIVLILLLQVVIHLPFMNRVAMGNHVWRQVNTLAVAKNYYEKDMNILYPRIDKNYGTNGVTGPQFTSYDYTLALIYKVFGFSETAHRWFSLIISLFAIWGTFAVISLYFPNKNAPSWGALALIGIPEFYYYSIAAVPDLLALAAMVWGWRWFYRYLESKQFTDALITGILLALAGMTKLMFLVPGFVFLGEIIRRKAWDKKLLFGFSLVGAISLGGSLLWYLWAKYLTSINGIEEFVHAIRFKENWEQIFAVFFKNASSDFMETWVGYPLVFPVVLGIAWILKYHRYDLRLLLSLMAATLYYVFMQHQLEHHGYYILLFVPFIALAISALIRSNESVKKLKIWGVLIALAPVWSLIRMSHNFNSGKAGMPSVFTETESRTQMQMRSKTEDLWIVGPDQSGCVSFYYLGAKGFPWYNLNDRPSEFSRFRSMGAKGIITDSEKEALDYCRKENLKVERIYEYKNWVWLRFI